MNKIFLFMNKIYKYLFEKYLFYSRIHAEKKNIKKKKNLINKVNLTDEQVLEVDKLWLENYGKKIPKDWHRLYTSYTGKFDKNYFPEILFTANILNKLNPRDIKRFFSDKTLAQYFYSSLDEKKYKVVKNYVYNCNGFYYDETGVITYEKTIEILQNIGEVIIKPTLDTCSGIGVALLNIKDGIDIISGKNIKQIFEEYNKNFAIQEKIIQHEDFAKLNPSSVNTIRLHTYICDGKVYSTPLLLRVGRANSVVDNFHAGGIGVGITKDGYLMREGFKEYGESFLKHPDTGIVFEKYHLPKIPEMIDFTIKYHYRIPHIGVIAWDLTVDNDNRIVIIETNISCPGIWLPQMITGESFFGENTEKMIRMLNENKK